MIIKLLLLGGLAAAAYTLMHGRRSALSLLVRRGIALLALALGAVAVLFPDLVTLVAHAVGVGRGTDLVVYVLCVTFLFTTIGLHLRLADACTTSTSSSPARSPSTRPGARRRRRRPRSSGPAPPTSPDPAPTPRRGELRPGATPGGVRRHGGRPRRAGQTGGACRWTTSTPTSTCGSGTSSSAATGRCATRAR